MYQTRKLLICGATLFILGGCVSTSNQFYWGQYEELVYEMYTKPGKATPQVQIDKLERDIAHASNAGQRIAPGVYAHLGFMYAAAGLEGQSKEAFNKEMALYPESKILIEGMLERASENRKKGRPSNE